MVYEQWIVFAIKSFASFIIGLLFTIDGKSRKLWYLNDYFQSGLFLFIVSVFWVQKMDRTDDGKMV